MVSESRPRYEVRYYPRFHKDLLRIPRADQRRVLDAVAELANDPRPPGCKKLVAGGGEWRIRVGDYRLLYDIDDAARLVEVLTIGNRRDMYR